MSAADRFRAADQAKIDAAQDDSLDATDLYDSERIAISQVFSKLGEYMGQVREMGSLQREVRDRFAEIGFVARCDLYQSQHEDHLPESERTWWPDITLTGRCEPTGEFDHERMGHEVRSNIMGKNQQGNVQKTQIGQTGFAKTNAGLIVPNR